MDITIALSAATLVALAISASFLAELCEKFHFHLEGIAAWVRVFVLAEGFTFLSWSQGWGMFASTAEVPVLFTATQVGEIGIAATIVANWGWDTLTILKIVFAGVLHLDIPWGEPPKK